MALKLNIKMFEDGGDALYVDPSPWNSSCESFDAGASKFNQSLENNEQVISAMREFLGSPMMTESLRPGVTSLTNCTNEAQNYFNSVNNWSKATMDDFNNYNKTGEAGSINSKVNAQTMQNVEANFDGSKIGLRSASDVDSFVERVEEVIKNITDSLRETTDAAESAKGSIPPQISNSFSSTVQQSHDAITQATTNMNNLIRDNVESFRANLKSWADSAASAASGSGN
ncbi:MAG: hypothetical protein IKF01_03755 [Bacilli bacterium]|nr:hypothetical protein [Bacilli bacterium]